MYLGIGYHPGADYVIVVIYLLELGFLGFSLAISVCARSWRQYYCLRGVCVCGNLLLQDMFFDNEL